MPPVSWVDDRDTHFRRETDYYNTYRRGWYVRLEIAVGMAAGNGIAVEAFYEPTLQFEFAQARTRIRTSSGVYAAEERPNYRITVHRVGIRFLWSAL